LALAALLSLPALAQVKGEGASFPSKVYERWAETFEKSGGPKVIYKASGSGAGVARISERAVDFGGSDTALDARQLSARKLVQIPMLVGGIVPVVHLPGVSDGRLLLSGDVLADLMAGTIARWNDPRVAQLNPGLALPNLPVRRIVRADRSGTTEGFTRYLAQVSSSFAAQVGTSQAPKWPGEVTAAEGNDGMVAALAKNEGGVAYVSYDRVLRDKLVSVRLRNASGRSVAASEAAFRAAILDSDLHRLGDDTASLMNRTSPEAWPITMTSFVLVDAEPPTAAAAQPALQFLYWCFMHGDELTRGTGFAPLPVSVQARLASRFAAVKARDGKIPSYHGI
jgi:phosphate transport system substrate-binding protein